MSNQIEANDIEGSMIMDNVNMMDFNGKFLTSNSPAPRSPQKSLPHDEHKSEKARISNRLTGFDPKNSNTWYNITQKFGANIKQTELLSIATVLATNMNLKLDRDAKRRKSVLIKWFEENWSKIQHLINYVVLDDRTA